MKSHRAPGGRRQCRQSFRSPGLGPDLSQRQQIDFLWGVWDHTRSRGATVKGTHPRPSRPVEAHRALRPYNAHQSEGFAFDYEAAGRHRGPRQPQSACPHPGRRPRATHPHRPGRAGIDRGHHAARAAARAARSAHRIPVTASKVCAMPLKPKRPCVEPRCPGRATDGSRCPRHAEVQARARRAWEQRTYDADWRRLSARILRERPRCEEPGCTSRSQQVDHVESVRRAPSRRLDPTNLRALCRVHHGMKTATHDGGFGHEAIA